MDRQKIKRLEEELMAVANRHIDNEKMCTEDVFGALCGVGFRVVQASRPAEAVSGGGDNILLNNLNIPEA